MPRRLSALLSAVLLLLGALAVSATGASAPERRVYASYSLPGGTSSGTTASTPSPPSLTETARADEDRVTVRIHDSAGTAVALAVDIAAPGEAAVRRLFCSSGVVGIRGGSTISVTPLAGRCADGRVSVPRGGTVELSLRRKPTPAASARGATPAHRFALVVGINDYAGSTHDTVGGVGDVLAVRRALIGSGWQSSHILTLTDGQATAAGIRAGLEWLRVHSSPQTFSLFHYSGHVCIASRGPCASGHEYLWSQDNTFITDTEVVSSLKRVQGHQWMDLSACEGGGFDDGYSSPTRMFTSASQANETAYEEPRWNKSVWSGLAWDYGYNQGLADPNGKSLHATIGQFASYAVAQAPNYTSKQPRGAQHPVFRGGSPAWTLAAPPGS